MNGCDVSACHRETYMGWRPLTERLGRKICEYHWHRHEDPEDGFDLFEAFGFRRPVRSPRRLMQTGTRRCDCDRALSHRRQCRAIAKSAAKSGTPNRTASGNSAITGDC
jgi:hypothetical protein